VIILSSISDNFIHCVSDDYPYRVQETSFYHHERRIGSVYTQLELLLSYLCMAGEGLGGGMDPFNVSRVLWFTRF
jgi:hypothetical protein